MKRADIARALALLLAGCGGQEVGQDAGQDAGPTDACASCALDSGVGVPDLGSAAYDAWLNDKLTSSTPFGARRYGGCWSNECGLVAVRFSEGKDCGELYVFDRTTHVCVGASSTACAAALCVLAFPMSSSECPPPKDAGAD